MSGKLRRANVTDNVKMRLLCDVSGRCPLCRDELVVKKDKKTVRVFDIAHIYPLNATEHEQKILAEEERLSSDIDSEKNFIALCKPCHKIYDTQKTVEEYRNLVDIKKTLNKLKEIRKTWSNQDLLDDIKIISAKIGGLDKKDIEGMMLSYDALEVQQKNNGTFSSINEFKASQLILNYYIKIKKEFKRIEINENGKSDFIFSQVKSYYLLLVMEKLDHDQIFDHMCEWFMNKVGVNRRDQAEVLVSFFIQNCEIFSDVTTK